MTNIGLPVPQGFTITTEACTRYYDDGKQIAPEIEAEIMEYVTKLEEITGKKFGDKENPLLVSVRSGARASMPGMMDTILNLGLNEDVVEVLAKKSGNPRWANDCYRRFIQMYSDVVMEVGKKYFEELIDKMKADRGVTLDTELTADDLHELAQQFKAEYKAKVGSDFPTDPVEQLMGAIKAVFRSWDNPRANVYRRDNDIPYSWGTAVNVQSMAFGNMGDDCGTGVAFTRNPATGEKKLFGEFLTNAQGEDVVAGIRTPMPIQEMAEKFPEAFQQFEQVCKTLEDHYRDMQDMEFTVEHGKLYMLQTRNGKRTATAALKIACALVDEGRIDEKRAVCMIDSPHPGHPAPSPVRRRGPEKRPNPWPAPWPPLPAPPAARSSSPPRTPRPGPPGARKSSWSALETSPEDIEGHEGLPGHPDRPRRHDVPTPPSWPAAWAPAACPAARTSTWMKRTRCSTWPARPSTRATSSPSTVPPAASTTAPSPRWTPPSAVSSAASWPGRTSTAACACAPTPTPPATPKRPASWARKASACAAPSTCSSTPTASPPSAR